MKVSNIHSNDSPKRKIELSSALKLGQRPPIYPVRELDRSKEAMEHANRSSEAENLVKDNMDTNRMNTKMTNTKRMNITYDLSNDHSPGIKRPSPLELSLSNKFEGGNDIDSQSNSSSTESPSPEKQGKYNRTMCQRFKNMRGLYNS